MRIHGPWTLAVVPAVVPAVFALAACGPAGGDGIASAGGTAHPSASASRSMSPEDAALAFTRCMRQHGINVPDPTVNGHGIGIQVRGKGVPRAKMDAAQKACQHFMDAGGKAPNMNDPKARDQMLRFARCMRQHGVQVPDPKPGEGIKISVPKGSRARFEAAQKACQKYQGGPGVTTGGRK